MHHYGDYMLLCIFSESDVCDVGICIWVKEVSTVMYNAYTYVHNTCAYMYLNGGLLLYAMGEDKTLLVSPLPTDSTNCPYSIHLKKEQIMSYFITFTYTFC
jgi:hypothetical protein